MNTNLTDTQKFRVANDIAKRIVGQHPAYGSHHWEPVQPVQQEERKNKMLWIILFGFALGAFIALLLFIAAIL